MIVESVVIVLAALGIDFMFGDPRSRYHPTAWIGRLIGRMVPIMKSDNSTTERIGGIIIVLTTCSIVSILIYSYIFGLELLGNDFFSIVLGIVFGSILLKTTIAIKGMEKHALSVIDSVERDDIEAARGHLSMIVKRNTNELDKNHILSGVLESVSENTVDGVTGPLFYYSIFGLFGAFLYRTINTIDSMIGYQNRIFRNIGWFGANCDKILNFIPSRLTGLVMVLAAKLLRLDSTSAFRIMMRDGRKLESPNAGYPMAALAGALNTKLEKIGHYNIGDGNIELSRKHIHSAISLMKLSSLLFCAIFTIPIIIVLSSIGWFFA